MSPAARHPPRPAPAHTLLEHPRPHPAAPPPHASHEPPHPATTPRPTSLEPPHPTAPPPDVSRSATAPRPLARTAQRLAVLGLLLGTAGTAVAAPTVVLLRTPDDRGPWRAAEARTRDELRLMGLRVEEVRAAPGSIDHLLDEHGAHAVIRIERTPAGAHAEVWIADPPAEPRRLQLTPFAAASDDPAVAALRAAELVHAGISAHVPADSPAVDPPLASPVLTDSPAAGPPPVPTDRSPARPAPVPTDSPAAAPPIVTPVLTDSSPARPTPVPADSSPRPGAPPPVAPSPFAAVDPRPTLPGDADHLADIPAPTRPRPRPARLRALGVALGVLGGPGGVPPLLDLALGLRVHLARALSLEPSLWAGFTPVRASFTAGAVRLGLAAAEAALVLTPDRPDARVAPRLAVGGGVALAWARGDAREPLDARTDLAVVASLRAAAGLAIRVRPRLRLRVDAGVGVLLPPIAVRIAGDEVARLGPLLLRGALGLEWQWPRPRQLR